MNKSLKIILLTSVCTFIVYLATSSAVSTLVVFSVVLIILFINETLNMQEILKLNKNQEILKIENKDLNKKIRSLERSLNYRNELDVGFIHLNSNGRLLYRNEYFIENVYDKDFEHYSQIENNEIYKVVYDIYNGKKNISNIFCNGKYYSIKFKTNIHKSRIRSVIIQFYDITKTEMLDKLHQNFLVDASHELNNPLASIIMASEIIDRENKSEISEILLKESQRMKNVINNIIEHSKVQTIDFEMNDIDLSKLCDSYSTVYSHKDIVFTVDIEDGIVVNGNYELLDRMFKNIIDNAFNYTIKGSINVILKTVDNVVTCYVIDSGIGIKKDDVDKVFERFYRADTSRTRSTGGSGIGLAIVKEIALVHDIVINVESEYGVGTTIKLEF